MDLSSDNQLRQRLLSALKGAELSLQELWLRYFALGGDADEFQLDGYLNAVMPMSAFQHDMLAHAINERLDEIAPPRAPYSREFTAMEDIGST